MSITNQSPRGCLPFPLLPTFQTRAENHKEPTHRWRRRPRRPFPGQPDIIIVIRAITFWRAPSKELMLARSSQVCKAREEGLAGPSLVGQLLLPPAGFCTHDELELEYKLEYERYIRVASRCKAAPRRCYHAVFVTLHRIVYDCMIHPKIRIRAEGLLYPVHVQ